MKCLGFMTPKEVFEEHCIKINKERRCA